MLWGVKGELDFSKKFCTAVIECEVSKVDPMDIATEIVKFVKEENTGKLPKDYRGNVEHTRETYYAIKLQRWKAHLAGKHGHLCSEKVRDYLDEQLPGWRDDFDERAMTTAIKIVTYINDKLKRNLPKTYHKNFDENGIDKRTPEQLNETDYAGKLLKWRNILSGNAKGRCSDKLRNYLDTELLGWRDDFDERAMKNAKEIVTYITEKLNGEMPTIYHKPKGIDTRTDTQRLEYNHALKLSLWKQALKGIGNWKCPGEVQVYLDKEIPRWSDEQNFEQLALNNAKRIVEFVKNENQGELPTRRDKPDGTDTRTDRERLENSYASLLGKWRQGKNCSDEVRIYLDLNLPGWSNTYDAMAVAKEIVAFVKIYGKPKDSKKKNLSKKQLSEQYYARKLIAWKNSTNGKGTTICPKDVKDYLDNEIPGWRNDAAIIDVRQMDYAIKLIKYVKQDLNGNLPTRYDKPKDNDTRTIEEKLENSYANKLADWRKALNGKRGTCSDNVRDYLDKELLGWRPNEITTPSAPAPASHTTPPPALPPPPAPPVKRKLKLKVKVPAEPKSTQPKKQTAIPIAYEQSDAEKSPHQFPPPSEIGLLHKTYLRMRSDTLHQKFKDEPQLWLDYQAVRKRNFATYDPASIPSNQIIQELEKIQTKRQKVVIDMGCGEAPIAHHFLAKNDQRFTFKNYDHQSGGDPLIQEVDISVLPLDDASVEIGIMSLALWGTPENCTQYIKESYRVLESGGKFYISDSTKKWSSEPLTPENGGELLRTLLTTNGFKIISEDIGMPFCLFVCTKIY